MSLIVASVVAAAAGIAAAGVVVRAWMKRGRSAGNADLAAPPAELPPTAGAFDGLPFGIDDVIQVDEATRWPRSAFLLKNAGETRAAILISREDGREQATVCFPRPASEVYWLEAVDVPLPDKPPSRLEIGGRLLDRQFALPVDVSEVAQARSDIGAVALFACYESSVGDVAVVLQGNARKTWHGRRLEAGDYDALGKVERDEASL